MTNRKETTIAISNDTRAKIQKLKKHPNQSCDEVVNELVSGATLKKMNPKK